MNKTFDFINKTLNISFITGAIRQHNSKTICLAARNGQANQKSVFINAIAESLFLLLLSFSCNLAFLFQHGQKATKT